MIVKQIVGVELMDEGLQRLEMWAKRIVVRETPETAVAMHGHAMSANAVAISESQKSQQ